MTMSKLHLEDLPEAVYQLTNEIRDLRTLITENKDQSNQASKKKYLSIREAAEFLGLSVPTIYSKVSKRELPFIKRGKFLYFTSADLEAYLQEGRTPSKAEVQKTAMRNLKGYKPHSNV